MVEAYSKVEDLERRTKSKRKIRTVEPGGYAEEQLQDDTTKKGKTEGIPKLSEKDPEEKILKIAEVCGVELPNPDRSKNYSSGSFGLCGIG